MNMRYRIGSAFLVLGAVLVLAGTALFGFNQYEAKKAEEAVQILMPELLSAIDQAQDTEPTEPTIPPINYVTTEEPEAVPEQTAPPTITVDGNGYIGYLSIPALNLNLPILAQWSYPNLQIAPCYYAGSVWEDDLVIMAHNYRQHFGRISDLKTGDSVIFTGVDGESILYSVVVLDVLLPTAVEDMTAGEYDLTLFTCTYGGQSRITLRCDRTVLDTVSDE